MRRLASLLAAFVLAIAFALPLSAEPAASVLSDAQLEQLTGRLAQAEADPTTDCAACISDCGRRYGRICNMLCDPFSVCSAMCAERRMECTTECRTDLSNCRRRVRSCQLDAGR